MNLEILQLVKKAINKAIENLSKKHKEHISVYGFGLDQRLTGDMKLVILMNLGWSC